MVENKFKKTILLLLMILIILPVTVLAKSEKKLDLKGERILDDAGVLLEEEKIELEKTAKKYSEKTDTEILVFTTADSRWEDSESFMADIYDDLREKDYKINPSLNKNKGNAVILALNMRTRDVTVGGFYKGKEHVDNSRASWIRESITEGLSSEKYEDAFNKYINLSYRCLKLRPGVKPNSLLFNNIFKGVISLIISFIGVGLMLMKTGGSVTVNEGTYRDMKNSRLVNKYDRFKTTSISKRYIPKNDNSSGGGMSGGGTSSGGHSYSSSSGKF